MGHVMCMKWALSIKPKAAETQLVGHFNFCLNKEENNHYRDDAYALL